MEWYRVSIPKIERPGLVRAVECEELGIAAGWMDRVIQVWWWWCVCVGGKWARVFLACVCVCVSVCVCVCVCAAVHKWARKEEGK